VGAFIADRTGDRCHGPFNTDQNTHDSATWVLAVLGVILLIHGLMLYVFADRRSRELVRPDE
jgi:hypothetical protein